MAKLESKSTGFNTPSRTVVPASKIFNLSRYHLFYCKGLLFKDMIVSFLIVQLIDMEMELFNER